MEEEEEKEDKEENKEKKVTLTYRARIGLMCVWIRVCHGNKENYFMF